MSRVKKAKGKQKSAKKSAKAPAYHHAEVAFAYLVKKSPQATEKLAKLFGRSKGAVEQIWSLWDGLDTKPSALAKKQMARTKELLGSELRSTVSVESTVCSSSSDSFSLSSGCCQSDRETVQPVHSFGNDL